MLRSLNTYLSRFLTKGISISLIDQLLVSGSHFLVQIILARALGLSDYGVFTALWLVLIFISSFHTSFIISPMHTLGPQKEDGGRYFSSLVWLQLGISIALFLIAIPIVIMVSEFQLLDSHMNGNAALFLLPMMTIGYICHDFFRKLFYTKKKEYEALCLDGAVYVSQLAVLAVLYTLGNLSIVNAILCIGSSYIMGAGFLFLRYLKISSLRHLADTVKEHWIFSRWLVAKSGLQWLSGNLFLIAAGSILGAAALGAVRMAQNVIGILNILFLTFENTVPVRASDVLKTGTKSDLFSYFKDLNRKTGLGVLGLLAFIAIFSKPILHIFYGEVSIETVYVLRGFCVLYLIVFLSTLKRLHIRTLAANQQIFMAYLLSAAFSLIAAYPMIKNWGLLGVVLGFIITQFMSLIYYSIYLNRTKYNL